MLKLIVRWLLLAAALLLVANVYSGVQVASFGAAMIAALVIGLFNALLRPVFADAPMGKPRLPAVDHYIPGS